MLVLGWVSFRGMPIDLFPNVQFPIVAVSVVYPGAGPSEIETLISQPIEEEISSIAGLKRLTSKNVEGLSQVVAEFRQGIDIQNAEQQIRDKVGAARARLPTDAEDPVVRRVDPTDQPIVTLSIHADLPEADLYDIANDVVKPRLEQIRDVGLIEIVGGRPREIHVLLDRKRLSERELSVQAVAQSLAASGQNVPGGKVSEAGRETIFRSIGEFHSLNDVASTVVNLFNNDAPTRLSDLGTVEDGLKDETSRVYVNGQKSLFLNIYRQSGTNTIAVADGTLEAAKKLSAELITRPGKPSIEVIRDASGFIRANIDDVQETIIIGVILTIVVVYFFLANGRSTIITALALPNSLIGAFILMAWAGFSVNVVSLLALSLAVGLLIDDAIVVRENIFRHIERGEEPADAARKGTKEVQLAVVATTLVVIAIFAPVAFMSGIIGQFLKQFGLTVCFAMAISLFDALTIAPMLSAYLAGSAEESFAARASLWTRVMGPVLKKFDRFETWLELKYETFIRYTLGHSKTVLAISFVIFIASTATLFWVPQVFIPDQDSGEFSVNLDLPPGADLNAMTEVSTAADKIIHQNKEVTLTAVTVGGRASESNESSVYVRLVPSSDRGLTTTKFKNRLRDQLRAMTEGNPKVLEFDPNGGSTQPLAINLIGNDQVQLEKTSSALVSLLRSDSRVRDVDSSYRPGKPELQIRPIVKMAQVLGVNTRTMGNEVRAQVEGVTPAKFRAQTGADGSREYDIRVRLKSDQRDLRTEFDQVQVPNLNQKLVKLANVALPVEARGPASIDRQDRGRTIRVTASLAPGASLATILKDIETAFKGKLKLPTGITYAFAGDAENFREMARSVSIALAFGVTFVYFVLASLYESFVTPLTIMLALPLALCGAFLALFLTGESLSLFAVLGIVMLLGVASKNSILLVDFARRLMDQGLDRSEALVSAGRTRLRPILMTSLALIAGTVPVAIGLNEASRQRTSMGVAIIGGLVSSTLLTLIVVPAAFCYIDRLRSWASTQIARLFGVRRRSHLRLRTR
jgi:HAE1 family hydrophobic/amphiphilic exporter-1